MLLLMILITNNDHHFQQKKISISIVCLAHLKHIEPNFNSIEASAFHANSHLAQSKLKEKQIIDYNQNHLPTTLSIIY